YFSNSACHAGASSGGSTPVTGFHSTIDSPDPVSRVVPPTTKVANIRAATASSHSRTARRRVWADGVRLLMAFACRQGMGNSNEAAAHSEGTFKSNNHTRRISLLVSLRLRNSHASVPLVTRAPRTISLRGHSRN